MMEEAILVKDLLALREQDRFKRDVRVLIEQGKLKTVVVKEYVKT